MATRGAVVAAGGGGGGGVDNRIVDVWIQESVLDLNAGRNTFGTCFGETGLKIRPDVFRHVNCQQKKHV